MTRFIIALVFCSVLSGSILGQDKPPKAISRDELLRSLAEDQGLVYIPSVPKEVDWYSVESQLEFSDTAMWLVASCDFQIPPQAWIPAEAIVTFTVTTTDPDRLAQDYELLFTYPKTNVKWLSDERVSWKGPHSTGDQYTVPIRFLPRETSILSFSIQAIRGGNRGAADDLMIVEWCLEEDGKLRYLRNSLGVRPLTPCPDIPVKSIFFEPDSITIEGLEKPSFNGLCFNVTVTPPFRLGDTSTIRYYLTPIRQVTKGIDFTFTTNHMDVVSFPDRRVKDSINPGDTLVLELSVVPRAIRDLHVVNLGLSYFVESIDRWIIQRLACTSLFNEDGSLRYVYHDTIKPLEDKHYPKSYPEADDNGLFNLNSSGFHMECDVIASPRGRTPAKVVITLTTVLESEAVRTNDYEFTIGYVERHVELLSDESCVWKGPRNRGDVYTIEIEFLPRESGPHFITLGHRVAESGQQIMDILHLKWCLDGAGEPLYMHTVDSRGDLGSSYRPVKTAFFGPDSVDIFRQSVPWKRQALSTNRLTITPPLRIGDTSTIRYYVMATEPLEDGFDFSLKTTHMQVVRLPERADRSIVPGETVIVAVDVVPAAVRNVQSIQFHVDPDSRNNRSTGHTTYCSALFNDDGSLRYIDDVRELRFHDRDYPGSFPEAEYDGKWRSRVIYKDGPQPDSTDLKGVYTTRRRNR